VSANFRQAVAAWRLGNISEAESICQDLLRRRVDVAQVLELLAEIHFASGRTSRAIESLQRLLTLHPRAAAARRRLGNFQLAAGAFVEAAATFRESLTVEPDNIRAHNNLGQALLQLGELDAAMSSFERALALDPGYAIASTNLSLALRRKADTLQESGRFESALPIYERAAPLRADDAEMLCNWANALREAKRPTEALVCCDRALLLQPDSPETHNNRAGALRDLFRHQEAVEACDRALALKPDYLEALCNRGTLLREMGDHPAAQESFRCALTLSADCHEARVGLLMALLPPVPASVAEVQISRETFGQELQVFTDWVANTPALESTAMVGAAQPFFLAYDESPNKELLVRYGRACAMLMERWYERNGLGKARPSLSREKSIRVGIVSAQIREHAVYRALTKGWIDRLGAHGIEVGVFHLGAARDAETEWARGRAAFFMEGHRTLPEWVDTMQAAALDVLIYPEIGMDPMTVRLASLRLAPHQAAAWGHPETTGLPTIDYYLSAQGLEPHGAEALYSEQLVRLPNLGCYYEPYDHPDAPLDITRLGIAPHCPLLLCPGTSYKYAPSKDYVLVEIARRLGRCQLVFFEPAIGSLARRLRARLTEAFRAQHLDPDAFLVWIPWQSPIDFFALLRRADVCLDTLGFSGFNTALQAIECDLPVVAYEGRFMRGRLASAILRRMNHDNLVTRDPRDYIDLAVRLATDKRLNNDIRVSLRAHRQRLFRDDAAIEGLAAFLIQAVS
jgi:predicted O-linked N-acetylglucosamine transferase (SPINDLY family)